MSAKLVKNGTFQPINKESAFLFIFYSLSWHNQQYKDIACKDTKMCLTHKLYIKKQLHLQISSLKKVPTFYTTMTEISK